jgi:RNA polymerase sigma factor (sigma-70 family)
MPAMVDQLSDAILLERFVRRREEAAFTALVRRHAPVVEGTCRRVLRDEHDIEDVLQATFLVLARKASRIEWRESVASWLCAVAHRLSLGARAEASRHRRRETSITSLTRNQTNSPDEVEGNGPPERWHATDNPLVDVERRELRRMLDDELLRLPEKYRAPVVLCYVEGRTHEEAARQLGWPSGSMSRRLERARALLRRRLVYRGISLALALAGALAIYAAWSATAPVPQTTAGQVRQAMKSLVPLSEDGQVGRGIATRLAGNPTSSSSDGLVALARRASAAAETIGKHDPGTNRIDWRRFSQQMRQSADQLSQAATDHDSGAMLLAARRLDSSCLSCHNLFLSGPPSADRLQ